MHPEIQKKLYEEIKEAYSNVEEFDCNNTKTLPYLQAVIHEGLRFWNPAPLGVQSLTGPEGATIAGTYIPPRTAVRVPHLSLMTDERYFPDGEKFWPERWTEDRSTGVKDIRAYVPFS